MEQDDNMADLDEIAVGRRQIVGRGVAVRPAAVDDVDPVGVGVAARQQNEQVLLAERQRALVGRLEVVQSPQHL